MFTAAIFVSLKHAASRPHLLHLSIDFSGSVVAGAGSSVVTEGAHMGGPALSLVPSLFPYTSSLTPRGSNPRRTGIKFNCLAVAFGRVRNLRAAVPTGVGDVTSRHVLLAVHLVRPGGRKRGRERERRGREVRVAPRAHAN